jgi:hypothetical protein
MKQKQDTPVQIYWIAMAAVEMDKKIKKFYCFNLIHNYSRLE